MTSSPEYQKIRELADPALLQSVDGLALVGRILVEEYLSGSHRSLRLGHGMEFSQYRPYEPGDDLRLLDWKLVARKNHYYIRQSELEAGGVAKFILDASASMAHEYNGTSKLDFARKLISALAYLASRQGDSVGLYAYNDINSWVVSPERKGQQYMRLLHALLNVEPKTHWLTNKLRLTSEKSLVLFVTDMYQISDEILDTLRDLNSPTTDVSVLHITSPDEWHMNYPPGTTLEDLETGEKVKVDRRMAEAYGRNWHSFIESVENKLHEFHIHYHAVRMDQPLYESIKYFLDRKARLSP